MCEEMLGVLVWFEAQKVNVGEKIGLPTRDSKIWNADNGKMRN